MKRVKLYEFKELKKKTQKKLIERFTFNKITLDVKELAGDFIDGKISNEDYYSMFKGGRKASLESMGMEDLDNYYDKNKEAIDEEVMDELHNRFLFNKSGKIIMLKEDYLKKKGIMKSENEKDFLKHFEKFVKLDKKLGKLPDKVKYQYTINDKLHYALKKDMNRTFFRNKMLIKHGKDLLDNANKMISLLSEEGLIFESQEKIIDDIKSAAEKMSFMVEKNKKNMAMRLGYLLKRKSNLLKQGIQAQIESFNLDEKVGKYAIKCGKGLMSIKNFKDEHHSLSKKAENFASILKNNNDVLRELHNKSLVVMRKYEEIINLFKKEYEY